MIHLRICILLLVGLLFAPNDMQAQAYDQAIGLRLGYPASVSYKTFLDDTNAIEGFLTFRSYGSRARNSDFRYRSFGIGGGYLIHKPIQEVDGLNWYYGVGGRLSFFNDNDGIIDEDDRTGLSVLGFLGLDYKFADAPINLSLDWIPAFRIFGYNSGFGGQNGALAVRYTF